MVGSCFAIGFQNEDFRLANSFNDFAHRAQHGSRLLTIPKSHPERLLSRDERFVETRRPRCDMLLRLLAVYLTQVNDGCH